MAQISHQHCRPTHLAFFACSTRRHPHAIPPSLAYDRTVLWYRRDLSLYLIVEVSPLWPLFSCAVDHSICDQSPELSHWRLIAGVGVRTNPPALLGSIKRWINLRHRGGQLRCDDNVASHTYPSIRFLRRQRLISCASFWRGCTYPTALVSLCSATHKGYPPPRTMPSA